MQDDRREQDMAATNGAGRMIAPPAGGFAQRGALEIAEDLMAARGRVTVLEAELSAKTGMPADEFLLGMAVLVATPEEERSAMERLQAWRSEFGGGC